jgi:2-iminobutanoate/2-iminopropanoate deaminase
MATLIASLQMRTTLRTLTVAFTLTLAFAASLGAQPGGRQVVNPNPGGRGSATLSPGIKAGDFVFSSGQLGAQTDTTIEMQTTTVLNRIKAIFEAAGTTMENATKCTVFLTDAADFQKMNGEYVKFWPKDPPARTTVVVAALVSRNAKVEIECVAAIPR